MSLTPTIYFDQELETLRQEVKTVEEHLQQITTEKTEIEKTIYEFGIRYNKELGELIVEILKWRKENAVGTSFQEETEEDFNSFFNSYAVSKNEKTYALTETEKQELKLKYRKASKICHPDIVADNQKDKAHKIFTELNSAYEMNNLEEVKIILESLENGELLLNKADTANEKIVLQLHLKKIRIKILDIEMDIKKLVASETYLKILNIENITQYFEKKKDELQQQLNLLKNGRQ